MEINSQILFYILISIILFNFIKDYFLDYLNSKFFDKKIPENLNDIYDKDKYLKSQDYKKTLYQFGKISKFYSLTILLLFIFLDGFLFLDTFTRSLIDSEILISLSFFGIFFFGSDILNLPFSLYSTFVIEEKFGFNKTTIKIYFFDKLKSWSITILFGGGIIGFIIIQFESKKGLLCPFFFILKYDRMGSIYFSTCYRASNVLFMFDFRCFYGV